MISQKAKNCVCLSLVEGDDFSVPVWSYFTFSVSNCLPLYLLLCPYHTDTVLVKVTNDPPAGNPMSYPALSPHHTWCSSTSVYWYASPSDHFLFITYLLPLVPRIPHSPVSLSIFSFYYRDCSLLASVAGCSAAFTLSVVDWLRLTFWITSMLHLFSFVISPRCVASNIIDMLMTANWLTAISKLTCWRVTVGLP